VKLEKWKSERGDGRAKIAWAPSDVLISLFLAKFLRVTWLLLPLNDFPFAHFTRLNVWLVFVLAAG